MFGSYSIVPNNFWCWKKTKPFLHLSLSKTGPFTLGNHSCDKALKCKVFQIIRCLIKPFLKNIIQTVFQGCTSWVAELLNNMNFWMVLYCAQQLLVLKKNQNILHLSLSKAGPFPLGNHICDKALKCKVFQIIRCLIKPFLKNIIQTIFQGCTSWVAELLNNKKCLDGTLMCPTTFGVEKRSKTMRATLG